MQFTLYYALVFQRKAEIPAIIVITMYVVTQINSVLIAHPRVAGH